MTRLLIVDDHEVVRQGLISAFAQRGFTNIQSAESVKQARSKIAVFNPEAVIVDLNLPDGSGFEIVQWVRKISKSCAVLVLSLNTEQGFVQAAQSSGANAYLSKSQSIDEVLAALNFALSSPASFSSKYSTTSKATYEELTGREMDVLQLLAHGASNAKICAALHISSSTVKTHVSSILRKMQASNRTEAAKKATSRGLILQ